MKIRMRSRWLLLCVLVLPWIAHAQDYSRTEVITYHDDLDQWVIGQIATVTCTTAIPIGIADLVWSYKYYPSWSFTYQCSTGCPTTSQTTAQTSDGVLRRYTFGNSYSSNAGQLLTETVEKNGVVHLAKNYTYLTSASGQPFPDNAGFGVGNPFTFRNRPLHITTTQLNGVTFKRTVNTFDSFVRPLSVTKSSVLAP